jgi:hypothetical protein
LLFKRGAYQVRGASFNRRNPKKKPKFKLKLDLLTKLYITKAHTPQPAFPNHPLIRTINRCFGGSNAELPFFNRLSQIDFGRALWRIGHVHEAIGYFLDRM